MFAEYGEKKMNAVGKQEYIIWIIIQPFRFNDQEKQEQNIHSHVCNNLYMYVCYNQIHQVN